MPEQRRANSAMAAPNQSVLDQSPISRPVSRQDMTRPHSRLSASRLSRPPSRALSQSQEALDEENRSYRRAKTPLKIQKRMFIGSADGTALARPLTAGLYYASQIANFEELDSRNIWDVPDTEKTRISQKDVQTIYRAKCVDQHCEPSFDRARRFHELICKQCKGTSFTLRQCGIGINSLRAIVDVLRDDDHYVHLDLSGNSLGKEGGAALGDLLRANSNLVVLQVQSAQLGEGMMDIAEALHDNNTLTALDFSGIPGIHRNAIWGDIAVSLSVMISTNTVLSHLNFSHCGLGTTAKKLIRSSASHCALTYLNLAGNKIGNECCDALAVLLQDGTPELLTLNLEENGIGDQGMESLATALGSGGKTAASLQHMYLSRNQIGVKGLTALSGTLREHAKMATISLSHNPLCTMGVDEDGYRIPDSIDGVAQLFLAVESAPAIESINVTFCNLKSLPPSLVNGLKRTRSLIKLNVADNSFGDEGAKLLAQGLAVNKSIRNLNFSNCSITTVGGSELSAAVEVHPTLQNLRSMQGKWNVHEAGLVDAVRHSKSIISVDFSQEALEDVKASLRQNKATMITNAGPQLAEQSQALALEEKAYVHTQEMITEEIKRREKLTETFKVTREKQKVASGQFKAELQELHDRLEHQTHVYKTLDKQLSSKEDEFMAHQRQCDQEKAKLRKRTENVISHKDEIVAQVNELKDELENESGPQVDELNELKRQLKVVHAEIAEQKRFIERQEEASKQGALMANVQAKSGAKATAKKKKK